MDKMTFTGIGNYFAGFSIMYGIIILLINALLFPSLTFVIFHSWVNITLGILLILSGLFVAIKSGKIIMRKFQDDQLFTGAMFAYVRNPIYAAWIILIVPGIVIITGYVLAITIPFIMYLIFKKYIHLEEEYLKDKFGEEYIIYKGKTNQLFPNILKPK